MMNGLSDKNLLAAFGGGDAEAFKMLYARHVRALTAYLLGMLGDRSAVDEIIQQVFIGFASRAGRLPGNSNVRGYLLASARNRLANFYRDQARNDSLERNYEMLARSREGNHHDASAALEAEEARKQLNRALSKLADAELEVVLLHTQGELSFTEIAAALEIPRGTAASRYRAAITRLRGLLDHE